MASEEKNMQTGTALSVEVQTGLFYFCWTTDAICSVVGSYNTVLPRHLQSKLLKTSSEGNMGRLGRLPTDTLL